MAYAIAKKTPFPKFQAIKYEKFIVSRLRVVIKMLNRSLKTFFADNKINEIYRKDDYVDDLERLLSDIAAFISINDNRLIVDILSYGRSLMQITQKQLIDSLKGILSVRISVPSLANDVFKNPLLDKNIDLMLKSWVSTNTSLIKTIQTDLLNQVGVVIESSYRSGLSMPALTEQLKSKFNISYNKARLIARDQTAKLHSNYIEYEHLQLGIKEYIWLTSNDYNEKGVSRVRHSHKVLNNKVCQWNNPTTYKDSENGKLKSKVSIGGVLLQVGEDYQCRCSLAAIVPL